MFNRGQQIAYIPTHVFKDVGTLWELSDKEYSEVMAHKDIERGFVTSGPKGDGSYFCRYWRKAQLGDLRTKSNSECTPGDRLITDVFVTKEVVERALEEYCQCVKTKSTRSPVRLKP